MQYTIFIICLRIYDSEKSFSFLVLTIFSAIQMNSKLRLYQMQPLKGFQWKKTLFSNKTKTVRKNFILKFKLRSWKHAKILPIGDTLFILSFFCKLMPEERDEHLPLNTSLALYIQVYIQMYSEKNPNTEEKTKTLPNLGNFPLSIVNTVVQ